MENLMYAAALAGVFLREGAWMKISGPSPLLLLFLFEGKVEAAESLGVFQFRLIHFALETKATGEQQQQQ